MKAMIFAAGLGSRMRPLTDNLPKALIVVAGKPLLEWVIRRLMFYNIREIIINVHYEAEQIKGFLKQNNNFGIHISISDESDLLLETGGGLKKAAWFFDDAQPFLVCNTDIFCDLNLTELLSQHLKNQCIGTLAVQKRATSRYFLFNEKKILSGWLNTKTGEVKLSRKEDKRLQMLAFSSFQILEPAIFEYMQAENTIFSSIDLFLSIAEQHPIKGFEHNANWLDIGTPQNIPQAEEFVKRFIF